MDRNLMGNINPKSLKPATQAEIEAETEEKFPDAAGLKYHPGVVKAWARWTEVTTTALADSYGVTSVTDNGTGATTVNLSITLSSSNACAVYSHSAASQAGRVSAIGTTSVSTNHGTTGVTTTDASICSLVVMGDI
ncbi:MAG: hypothetical protein GEU76_03860 [Alphaproteobacteria bacterium]|nr:hypothetical protein [Alphaproteobacteria bacterium]